MVSAAVKLTPLRPPLVVILTGSPFMRFVYVATLRFSPGDWATLAPPPPPPRPPLVVVEAVPTSTVKLMRMESVRFMTLP